MPQKRSDPLDDTETGPVPNFQPNPVPPDPGRDPIPAPERPGDSVDVPPERRPFPDHTPGGPERPPM
jgi:hypothetical protein